MSVYILRCSGCGQRRRVEGTEQQARAAAMEAWVRCAPTAQVRITQRCEACLGRGVKLSPSALSPYHNCRPCGAAGFILIDKLPHEEVMPA